MAPQEKGKGNSHTLLAGVHELAGVQTLDGDEQLLLESVAVGVAEGNASERSASAGVVDDILHDALDVTAALSEVKSAELGCALAVVGVGLDKHRVRLHIKTITTIIAYLEDGATSLPLA